MNTVKTLSAQRGFRLASTGAAAVLALAGATTQAQTTSYTSNSVTTAWNTGRWNNTSDASPYTSAYTANNNVSFTSGSYSFAGMGATINVGNVTLADNVSVTFASASNTFATSGTVRAFSLGTGAAFNFNGQTISTASGTGFSKTGAGTLIMGAGGAFAGGFTLGAGTVVAGGVNALGAGGSLALNGGTLTVNNSSARDFSGKYAGGISIGGNVQFGDLANVPAGTGDMTFTNAVSLGTATRTVTIGSTGTYTLSGVIQGNAGTGLTISALSGTAGGNIVLGGANTFSGAFTANSGTTNLSVNGALGGVSAVNVASGGTLQTLTTGLTGTIKTTAALTINGTLDVSGGAETVGSLAGTNTGAFLIIGKSGTASGGFVVGDATSTSFAGVIRDGASGTGTTTFTKQGSGTLTLTGGNPFTGSTTISAGTLKLANTSSVALSGTTAVLVNNGGTLLFGANNQINLATTPPITLGSATGSGTAKIDAGGFSQGTAYTSAVSTGNVGLGALTLRSNSIIDLTDTSVLHFASSTGTTWTGTLSILDWNGTLTTGGGSEQLLFGSGGLAGLNTTQLAQIQFVNPAGLAAGTYAAAFAVGDLSEIVPNGLVPVPEPATWAAGFLALVTVCYRQRRRVRGFLTTCRRQVGLPKAA